MRVSRYMFSERINPWMAPIAMLASHLKAEPSRSGLDNPWMQLEQLLSQSISKELDQYRQIRDAASERAFSVLYGGSSVAPGR